MKKSLLSALATFALLLCIPFAHAATRPSYFPISDMSASGSTLTWSEYPSFLLVKNDPAKTKKDIVKEMSQNSSLILCEFQMYPDTANTYTPCFDHVWSNERSSQMEGHLKMNLQNVSVFPIALSPESTVKDYTTWLIGNTFTILDATTPQGTIPELPFYTPDTSLPPLKLEANDYPGITWELAPAFSPYFPQNIRYVVISTNSATMTREEFLKKANAQSHDLHYCQLASTYTENCITKTYSNITDVGVGTPSARTLTAQFATEPTFAVVYAIQGDGKMTPLSSVSLPYAKINFASIPVGNIDLDVSPKNAFYEGSAARFYLNSEDYSIAYYKLIQCSCKSDFSNINLTASNVVSTWTRYYYDNYSNYLGDIPRDSFYTSSAVVYITQDGEIFRTAVHLADSTIQNPNAQIQDFTLDKIDQDGFHFTWTSPIDRKDLAHYKIYTDSAASLRSQEELQHLFETEQANKQDTNLHSLPISYFFTPKTAGAKARITLQPGSDFTNGTIALYYETKDGGFSLLGNTLYISPNQLRTYTSMKTPLLMKFTDIGSDAWYRAAVEDLFKRGLTSGRSPTEFAPTSNLTRAEAAAFLAKTLLYYDDISNKNFLDNFDKDEYKTTLHYKDVSVQDWYAPYLIFLIERREALDTSKEYFRPNDPITRAEFIKLAFAVLSYGLPSPMTYVDPTFKDTPDQWYREGLKAFYNLHIIQQADYFRPGDTINRAEAAIIIYKSIPLMLELKARLTSYN